MKGYNKLLDKVKASYKHTDMLYDIYLENYNSYYIYIRLDYYKKSKCYKLSWIDLTNVVGNKFEDVISYEYIPMYLMEQANKLINNIQLKEYKVKLNDKNIVRFNSGDISVSFNDYIPLELKNLLDIFIFTFNNLPHRTNEFLQRMMALITGQKNRFEYREGLDFDLFKDKLENVFEYQIIERGKEYYKEGRVLFLEKIDERYFAVVGGKELYVVIIKYDSENNKTYVYCSCPCDYVCKHICAVILSIRDNKFRKFYKITRVNDDMPLMERLMNFNFMITIGIDDQGVNYLVIEDGQIKILPVLNKDGISAWKVLEDDSKNSLSKRLKDICDK